MWEYLFTWSFYSPLVSKEALEHTNKNKTRLLGGLRSVGSIIIKMLKIFVVLSWDDIVRLGTVSAAGGGIILLETIWNQEENRISIER